MASTAFVVFFISVLSLVSVSGLQQDESCTRANGQTGVCIPSTACTAAVRRQNCGFNSDGPLVCCSTFGIKSRKKCGEYHNIEWRKTFSRNIHFATGGELSLAQEFPHMAALGFGDKVWKCGGSLVSEQFVLTAAHCLFSRELGNVTWIRLGDLDLHSTHDDAKPQDFRVVQIHGHPNYNPPSRYHDIAILKMDRRVEFNGYIKPICLEHRTKNLESVLIASGWGALSYMGEASPHLIKVFLNRFTYEECRFNYSGTEISDETHICAGGRTESRDTCQGDSGGPLMGTHANRPLLRTLVGITSFGKPCGTLNVPGVYTRVSHYLPWIESIVWPESHGVGRVTTIPLTMTAMTIPQNPVTPSAPSARTRKVFKTRIIKTHSIKKTVSQSSTIQIINTR